MAEENYKKEWYDKNKGKVAEYNKKYYERKVKRLHKEDNTMVEIKGDDVIIRISRAQLKELLMGDKDGRGQRKKDAGDMKMKDVGGRKESRVRKGKSRRESRHKSRKDKGRKDKSRKDESRKDRDGKDKSRKDKGGHKRRHSKK